MILEDISRIAEAMPDYDIERELGRGGMGIVFLGRHRRLLRGAAIKELPPTIAADTDVRDRFVTEAQTLAGLAHPHIVPIFDYVERSGECLIVMQELPGGSVWDRFTTTGLTPPTACAVVMACCAALQHAHDHGVLHLDVKPDNLMFDAESAVKVTDFGISRVITGGRTMGTVDGQVLGTPAYMSPEQARGEELTAASDVYACGVMLYELLSGQLPWHGAQTAAELLQQRLTQDPIPLRDQAPNVPPMLADVVMRSLARDVEDRFATAEDFGIAIGEACAESWGPEWIDHAGVAIVGSEKLSIAARTTSHVSRAAAAPPAPATDVLDLTAPASPTVPGATTTGGSAPSRAPATGAVLPAGAVPTSAAQTGSVSVPGAAATGAVAPVGDRPSGAAETGVRPAAGSSAPPTAAGAPVPAASPAPETIAAVPLEPTPPEGPEPGPVGDDGEDQAAIGPDSGPATPPLEFEVIRASSNDPRISGADLYGLELADLINVRDVLNPPSTPWKPVLLTGILFGLVLVVGLIGLGGHDRQGTLAAGQVLLDGQDVTAPDHRFEIDLSEEFTVEVRDPALAAGADEVELTFHYLGREAPGTSAALRDGVALFEPSFSQRAVGGAAETDVRLLSRSTVVANQEIGIDATQNRLLTGPFAIGVLLILLGYAELESSLKPLRSGHTRIRSYLGAAIWCPIAAVGVLLLLAAFGFNELTEADVIAAVILSAAGGITLVRARTGVARRRRVRNAVKRAETRLGQQDSLATTSK